MTISKDSHCVVKECRCKNRFVRLGWPLFMQQEEQKTSVWEASQCFQSTGSQITSALLTDEIQMACKEEIEKLFIILSVENT